MKDPGALYAFLAGFGILLLASLPAALMVHAWRPSWTARIASAHLRRRTASVLAGAGLFLVSLFAAAVFWNARGARPIAVLIVTAVWALYLAGFAGGSLALGRALTGREDGTRVLVAGWIVRSLSLLVPLLDVVVAAYLTAASLGAPLVALLDRGASGAPKETAAPSDGSTPAN